MEIGRIFGTDKLLIIFKTTKGRIDEKTIWWEQIKRKTRNPEESIPKTNGHIKSNWIKLNFGRAKKGINKTITKVIRRKKVKTRNWQVKRSLKQKKEVTIPSIYLPLIKEPGIRS